MSLKWKEKLVSVLVSLSTALLGTNGEAYAWSKGSAPPPSKISVPVPNSTVSKQPKVPNRAPIQKSAPPTKQSNEYLAQKKLYGDTGEGIPMGFPPELTITDEDGSIVLIRFGPTAGLMNRNMDGWPETEFEPIDPKTKLPVQITVRRLNNDVGEEAGQLIKIKSKFDPANGPVQLTEVTIRTWEQNEIGGRTPILKTYQTSTQATMRWDPVAVKKGLVPKSALAAPTSGLFPANPSTSSTPTSPTTSPSTPSSTSKASDGY